MGPAQSSPIPAFDRFLDTGAGVPVNTRYKELTCELDSYMKDLVAESLIKIHTQRIEKLPISCAWKVSSPHHGPTVTIFGGVHGLETCGVDGVLKLLTQFASAEQQLIRGSVVLALGNEAALKNCERQVQYNMNRLFVDSTQPLGDYETKRACELRDLLKQTDWFLDLHSTSAPTEPFAVLPAFGVDFAAALGLERVLVTPEAWRSGVFKGTSSEYVIELSQFGAPKPAITVENGQHADPAAAEHAHEMALRFLRLSRVLWGGVPAAEDVLAVTPFHIEKKQREGFEFAKLFKNFDTLLKGELIGADAVQEYRAPRDCHILLPTPQQQSAIGVELYLLGEGKWHPGPAGVQRRGVRVA